jgi:hypothetical protein
MDFFLRLLHLSTNRAVEKIVVLQHCDSDVEDVNIHSEGLAMLLSWFRSTERPRVAVRGNGTKLSLLPGILCDESSAL